MTDAMVMVEITGDGEEPSADDGSIYVPTDDGGVVVHLNPSKKKLREASGFDDNLALEMDGLERSDIAERLLEGIAADDASRQKWLEDRKTGIVHLGLELEKPKGEATAEGVSSVRHPVLAEAVLRFQANARGELLPADGPVKITNVNIMPNVPAPTPTDGSTVTAPEDKQAAELERGFNYYLTVTAPEYYPDFNRMLFWCGLGGSGWRKGYHCPLRRRPVVETVDAAKLIVSNAATDLCNAERVTHEIDMRQSVMKRMMFLGMYREADLQTPSFSLGNVVEEKLEAVAGVTSRADRPEDAPYTVYETQCELDLDDFAPEAFKGKGIALPYRVTVEKDSREVLEVRRDWKEDDEQAMRKKRYIRYPYIDGFGIYGIGLLHILGNSAAALTAGWRIALDAGMFNNFPGGLVSRVAARGLPNNTLRVNPGSYETIDTGGADIRQAVMALPYKPLDQAFVALLENIATTAQRVGGTAEVMVGEGKQEAPVGTTIALIEQATKVEASVHKGLHAAQSEEFALLKELFREDPGAFMRHNKAAAATWDEAKFLAALENMDLVPRADPNTSSHMQRVMRAVGLKQLQTANPGLYDAKKVDIRIMNAVNISDPEDLFAPPMPPAAAPPDPAMLKAQADLMNAETKKLDSQTNLLLAKMKILAAIQSGEQKDKDRESKEKIAVLELAQTLAIHQDAQDEVAATIAAYGTPNPKPPKEPSSKADGGRVL